MAVCNQMCIIQFFAISIFSQAQIYPSHFKYRRYVIRFFFNIYRFFSGQITKIKKKQRHTDVAINNVILGFVSFPRLPVFPPVCQTVDKKGSVT